MPRAISVRSLCFQVPVTLYNSAVRCVIRTVVKTFVSVIGPANPHSLHLRSRLITHLLYHYAPGKSNSGRRIQIAAKEADSEIRYSHHTWSNGMWPRVSRGMWARLCRVRLTSRRHSRRHLPRRSRGCLARMRHRGGLAALYRFPKIPI